MTAPFEPNQCLELVWSLMFLLEENKKGTEIGEEAQNRLNQIMKATTDPQKKLYLLEITNAILSCGRVGQYRSVGMQKILDTYDDVQRKKVEELNNLGTVTTNSASLIPRAVSAIGGGTLGGILRGTSIPEVLETTFNFVIPSY